jgi:hypothetical protein
MIKHWLKSAPAPLPAAAGGKDETETKQTLERAMLLAALDLKLL